MDILNKEKLTKKSNILIALIFLFQILIIISNLSNFNPNKEIGYLDHQLFWEGIDRVSNGEVIYKDFYWEYGWLYLVYGLPIFYLLGGSIKAYIIIRLILIPITNLVLLYFIGREFLKKHYLAVFLLFGSVYGTLKFGGLRHLLPELGLLLSISGLKNRDNKKLFLGSIFLGLSLTSSIEYSVIAFISLFFYAILYKLRPYKKGWVELKDKLKYFAPILIIGTIFFLYLYLNGALLNMFHYYSDSAKSFYTNSPCREVYPRLNLIKDVSFIEFLSRFRLYVVPITLAFSFIYAFKKRNSIKYSQEVLTFVLYSSIVYARTLVTPCIIYFEYGLVLFSLYILLLLSKRGLSKNIKIFLYSVLVFMFAFALPNTIITTAKNLFSKNTYDLEYSGYLDIKLEKNLAQQMDEIFKYVEENTSDNDTIFTYPQGPYHHVLDRKSPISVISTLHYQLSPHVLKNVMEDFETNPPDYIIFNNINASSYLCNISKLPYNIVSVNNTPVLIGYDTPVETYISENYKIVKKFENAWILKKNDKPVPHKDIFVINENVNYEIRTQNLEATQDSLVFRITGKNPTITYIFKREDLKGSRLLNLPSTISFNSFKYFSKYNFIFYASNDMKSYSFISARGFLDNTVKDHWIILLPGLHKLNQKYFTIRAVLSNDEGFLPFMNIPNYLYLKNPEVYVLNPEIEIDDYLIENGRPANFGRFITLE